MKHNDPKAKKYNRYLKKYVGIYRVKALYDLSTGDFPRDSNGNLDESFEDLYIPCRKGIIKHAYCDVLCWYTDKISQGRNVLKELKENKPEVIIDYEETSKDFLMHFNSEDILRVAEIVSPLTGGANINPFSVRNLPKPEYTIAEEDDNKLKELLSEFDNTVIRTLGIMPWSNIRDSNP